MTSPKYTDKEANPLDLMEIANVTVSISIVTAVATGLLHEKGKYDGMPYEFRGRTMMTFVKRNGRWDFLAIHD